MYTVKLSRNLEKEVQDHQKQLLKASFHNFLDNLLEKLCATSNDPHGAQ